MHQNQKSTLFTRKRTLLQEIKRDPLAADLLFTLFASAVGTDFFDPNTPTPKEKTLEEIVKTMPPMQQLASYSNESELIDAIGSEAFDVLRCAILDCPSAYALLNDSLEIPELKRTKSDDQKCYQFAVIESPAEKEKLFQLCKDKANDSIYLTHGSIPERWNQINREELKDSSKYPELMLHGAAYGPGIGLTPDSSFAHEYARETENKYPNSQLGNKISIIALCEVANFPDREEIFIKVDDNKILTGKISSHQLMYTLTLEEACIIRYLIVNTDAKFNTLKDQQLINHLKSIHQ